MTLGSASQRSFDTDVGCKRATFLANPAFSAVTETPSEIFAFNTCNHYSPAMPLPLFFRRLLLLYILFIIAELVSADATLEWLPEPLRKFEEARYSASEADPDVILLSGLFLTLMLSYAISLIGLWKFWQPARTLFGTTILLSILMTGLGGPYVVTALTNTFAYIESILSGLILALIYFSPIKEFFEKPAPEAPPEQKEES